MPLLLGGSLLCWQRPTSSGTHHCPGSVPSADCSALWLDAGPCATSTLLRQFSLWPLP
jgi:hypothetical protein